jgi:hypothetical protein
MMAPVFALLVALILAGCASEDGGARRASASQPVTAGFLVQTPDVIELSVDDRQPVDRVELLAPDGRVYLAHRIDREKATQEPRASTGLGVGVGVFGGSSTKVGTSFGIGIPLGGIEAPPTEPRYSSIALVRVEDMAGYRAGWRRWILRIRLGTPETSFRFMEIPGPRPPDS